MEVGESVQSEQDQGQSSGWDPTQGPPVGSSPEVVQWYNQAQQGFQKKAEELNSRYQWASPYEERLKEADPDTIGAWIDWYGQLQNDPDSASETFYGLGRQLGYLDGEDDGDAESSEEQDPQDQMFQELMSKVEGLEASREEEKLMSELDDAFDELEDQNGEIPDGIEDLLIDRVSRLAQGNSSMGVRDLVFQSYEQLQKEISGLMGQKASQRSNQPEPAVSGGSEPSVGNDITSSNMHDYIHSRLRDHFNA